MMLRRRSSSGPARRLSLALTLLALLALAGLPAPAQAFERASLVRDITPGPASTHLISPSGVLGGALLFTAMGPEGAELWRSDGTAAGTTVLKDINPGPSSSLPSRGVIFQGRLYFGAMRSSIGFNLGPRDLFRTDGTPAGTELVKDLGGLSMGAPVLANGALFFTVGEWDGSSPPALWRSDGTAAGSGPIPGGPVAFSGPGDLTGAPGQLFFTATDSAGFVNLFRTDGTAAGTRQLTQLRVAGWRVYDPIAVGDRLFFAMNDGVHGIELWTSDGTAAGTRLVKDLNPGAGNLFIGDQVAFDGRLVFSASGVGGPAGSALLITDGTAAGTQTLVESPSLARLSVIDGKLYFTNEPVGASGIWVSDGTPAGTRQFVDLLAVDPSPFDVAEIFGFNGAIYFIALGSPTLQIWRTDGTAAGTLPVTHIVSMREDTLALQDATAVGGTLFFVASDNLHGTELWKLVDDPAYPGPTRAAGGLLALYTFGEGVGTTVYDRSGVAPALDLKLANAEGASWVSYGLHLKGSTGLYSGAPAGKIISAAQASEEVTIEAWLTPDDVQQYSARIVTISGSATRRNVALIHGVYDTQQPTVASARIRVDRAIPDGSKALLTPDGSLGPRLTHLVYTRAKDGTVRLYVDGALAAKGSRPGTLGSWDPAYQLALGGEIPGQRYWRGTYHLVAIYGRALSAAEVGQNFAFGPFVR